MAHKAMRRRRAFYKQLKRTAHDNPRIRDQFLALAREMKKSRWTIHLNNIKPDADAIAIAKG